MGDIISIEGIMNIFKFLQTKSKEDVIALGIWNSVHKDGFAEFAYKNWNLGDGDYIRAIVASVELLKIKPDDVVHDISALNFVYGDVGEKCRGLLAPIQDYFDEKQSELSNLFLDCLKRSEALSTLQIEMAQLLSKKFTPLIKSLNLYKLKSHKNQRVRMVLSDGKNQQEIIRPMRLIGCAENPLIFNNGQRMNLLDAKSGIVSIQDADTLEMLFQNVYIENDNLSDLKKTGFIFGIGEAEKLYNSKLRELSNLPVEEPACVLIDEI